MITYAPALIIFYFKIIRGSSKTHNSPSKATLVLNYFYTYGQYTEMLKDLNSGGVCRHFRVDYSNWNKNSCHDKDYS